MAGGIFVDQPFHPNPKCLLFSAVIMALYWFSSSTKNTLMLPIIFVVSYVAMAWYDYMYHCDTIMRSGYTIGPNTLDAIFKPQRRNEVHFPNPKNVSKNQEHEYLRRVYLFHVLFVSPILLYIGFRGKKTGKNMFPVLLSLGFMSVVYHGFRIFYPRQTHLH